MDRLDAAFPDLQERIGARAAAFVVFELDPRVDRQHDVGVFALAGPFDLLVDDHVDLRQHVDDEVVDPLRLVEKIGVVVPEALGGRRQVGLAGEGARSTLGKSTVSVLSPQAQYDGSSPSLK